MAPRTRDIFTTIHIEGAILPPDLLQQIAERNSDIEGLRAEDYHLSGEKLHEAINRSWNVLLGAWANFQAARERLPEGDTGTTITRERWLLPLFRELDYGRLPTARAVEIDGKTYPISHRNAEGNVPIHLVGCNVNLDRRTKGVAGAATMSPHSMMQVFLNRSDDHLWGFLSNGLRLRILRDNVSLTRQAYVEFDLEAMMAGEVYADFVLLWLLCHSSRVEGERPEQFWLERWMQTAVERGTRALDQLRDNVQRAIEALGEGFLAHPHNTDLHAKLQSGRLDPQDYYRQLLRLVYRLLFLFVAEDRGLLLDPNADEAAKARYTDYYSTRRLRNLAERFRGTRHHDLYHGLRLVMQLLGAERNGAGRALGLPMLGSYLFSNEAVADIVNCEISNYDLLEAIRALAFVEDRVVRRLRPVDYRHLGPEELGSIYESLLELHPQINVDARTFALGTASGHERKTTGSYYTPSSLIHALLDSALDPVLEEARAQGEEAILDLKVCDPACGSGHFLIAAAHRMAKALASVRTMEDEPAPDAVRSALREVIGHCIYGVDINPMAVELCKVGLWMESLEPGKPLTFLDHHIQCGNSLMGTTPALMAQGIPNEAFPTKSDLIVGDENKVVSGLRKRNRQERKARETGQRSMFEIVEPPADYAALAAEVTALDAIHDTTLAGVRAKESRYRALADDPEYIAARFLADAWCAAFVWHKAEAATFGSDDQPVPSPITDLTYRLMEKNPHDARWQAVRSYVAYLRERYQFFHWHVAFPDVFHVPNVPTDAENKQTGWSGGFDVVLGNPPWERIKIQEKEWFSERAPEIAKAPNAAERRKLINKLKKDDPALHAAFMADKRKAEGLSHFVRKSGRYPLCGRGDVNTYTVFAETARQIVSLAGRAGIIVPSGIATDDTTKYFFQDLMQSRTLVSLYDFENREGLFPEVDSRMKFCLLTMTGSARPVKGGAEFVFFAHSVADLADPERRFTLSAEDIALINPNTGTVATFRSGRDAELTKAIYRRVPVLVREGDPERGEPVENPWGITFLRMFDMSNDSHLFRTREELEAAGYRLVGNRFVRGDEVFLPLYEAKMIHQFTHRWATYERNGKTREMTVEELRDPLCLPLPRYWVDEQEVEARIGSTPYMIGFRDITNTTNERTAILGVIPRAAVSNKLPLLILNRRIGQFFPLMITDEEVGLKIDAGIVANMCSSVLDYSARQKMGGTSLNFFIAKQLPVLPPKLYYQNRSLLNFIVPRVLELTYTAWDLQPFARDVGYDGPPFVWDEERRFLMRCELDALYFHLYGIARDDVDYIMETFPIVRRKDEAAHGEYRTKRVILAMYDQMAALPQIAVPAPKDPPEEYLVPDVSQFETWLNPPPADPRVAHPPHEG